MLLPLFLAVIGFAFTVCGVLAVVEMHSRRAWKTARDVARREWAEKTAIAMGKMRLAEAERDAIKANAALDAAERFGRIRELTTRCRDLEGEKSNDAAAIRALMNRYTKLEAAHAASVRDFGRFQSAVEQAIACDNEDEECDGECVDRVALLEESLRAAESAHRSFEARNADLEKRNAEIAMALEIAESAVREMEASIPKGVCGDCGLVEESKNSTKPIPALDQNEKKTLALFDGGSSRRDIWLSDMLFPREPGAPIGPYDIDCDRAKANVFISKLEKHGLVRGEDCGCCYQITDAGRAALFQENSGSQPTVVSDPAVEDTTSLASLTGIVAFSGQTPRFLRASNSASSLASSSGVIGDVCGVLSITVHLPLLKLPTSQTSLRDTRTQVPMVQCLELASTAPPRP